MRSGKPEPTKGAAMAVCDLQRLFVKTWFTNFEMVHTRTKNISHLAEKEDAKKFSKQKLKDVLQPELPGFKQRKEQLVLLFADILGGGVVPDDAFADMTKDFMWLTEHVLKQAEPVLYSLFHCVARRLKTSTTLPENWFDPAFPKMKLAEVFGAGAVDTNAALKTLDGLLRDSIGNMKAFYPDAAALGKDTVEAAVNAILS
jgi:hypothetical protein